MKDDFILAYLLRVDEQTGKPYKGYLSKVKNSLETEQRYVNFDRSGGLIDVLEVDGIDLIFNDEGKILELPNNRVLLNDDGSVWDIIVGNIMCVRHNAEGEFTSIQESDIEIIERRLRAIYAIREFKIFLYNKDELSEYKEGDSSGRTD